MNKTYISISSLLITGAFFLQGTLPVSASTLGTKSLINSVNHMENQASKAADIQGAQVQNVIKRADTMIENRITALNTLSTRIQNDARLSADEKTSLAASIQTEITGLTGLKAKIDADTDITTARADAKQIVTNYYVFATFEPKVRLLITLHNLKTEVTTLQTLLLQLQNLTTTLHSQGKDVSKLTDLITDINGEIETINTTLTADITTVQNVPITADAKATFVKVRQDISTIVRTSFGKIKSDIGQMRTIFKQLILPKPSSATSASSSAATSLSPTP